MNLSENTNRNQYDRQKSRCYDHSDCPYHELVEKRLDRSLPRWAFLSAFGIFISLAMVFAGWHVSSLEKFDSRYYTSVNSLHDLAEENRGLLIKIETKQNIVLKKLDLSNGK